QRSREGQSSVQELAAQSIIAVGVGAGSYPTVHAPPPRYHRDDPGHGQRPVLVRLADPGQQAVVPRAAEQVAVQQPGPTPEHGFFPQTIDRPQGAVQQPPQTRISGHRSPHDMRGSYLMPDVKGYSLKEVARRQVTSAHARSKAESELENAAVASPAEAVD